jgi:hypothetical protein
MHMHSLGPGVQNMQARACTDELERVTVKNLDLVILLNLPQHWQDSAHH